MSRYLPLSSRRRLRACSGQLADLAYAWGLVMVGVLRVLGPIHKWLRRVSG